MDSVLLENLINVSFFHILNELFHIVLQLLACSKRLLMLLLGHQGLIGGAVLLTSRSYLTLCKLRSVTLILGSWLISTSNRLIEGGGSSDDSVIRGLRVIMIMLLLTELLFCLLMMMMLTDMLILLLCLSLNNWILRKNLSSS